MASSKMFMNIQQVLSEILGELVPQPPPSKWQKEQKLITVLKEVIKE